MKKLVTFCWLLLFFQLSFTQILSFTKLKSFSVTQIDSMAAAFGVPSFAYSADYPVDYYKLTYLTPYITMNNLVQASASVAVPILPNCDLPLAAYAHGTNSKKSQASVFMNAGQWDINVMFASNGYLIVLPDGLGLGEADTSVVMHPYIHAFSQANTTINGMRAARELADTLGVNLNGQVFLYGYSQGGYTTVATVREIEQKYANEFNITASAPMSGPYDLKGAQVDLMSSDSVYPTPGYFPFVVLSYQSIYGNLYNTLDEVFKTPYDSTMEVYFKGGNYGIGYINGQCTPVPKHIAHDTVISQFLADSTHPLRMALVDNHLIDGWVPQAPMKLFYCSGDDQVSYLNSENAYNAWVANGAGTSLEKDDLGNLDHGGCATFAFLEGKGYFDSKKIDCNVGFTENLGSKEWSVYPNPAHDRITINWEGKKSFAGTVELRDLMGRSVGLLYRGEFGSQGEMDLKLPSALGGLYFLEIKENSGEAVQQIKLLLQ